MKTAIAVIFAGVLVAGAIFASGSSGKSAEVGSTSNVRVENGKQIIEISAKAGYAPKLTDAKAGMDTQLILKTNDTFDCSSELSIPKLGIRKQLPQTGETTIDVPSQIAGADIRGICAMGMNNFQIRFN